jgi:Domain of unknown function (DUF3943)
MRTIISNIDKHHKQNWAVGLILLYNISVFLKQRPMRHSTLSILIIVFLMHIPSLYGQYTLRPLRDTVPVKVATLMKRPLPAILENLTTNIFINRVDADLRDLHWGKVTPATWIKNIKTGVKPDYDRFSTNWVGHPYHGSIFYNAARANGYNYWESFPFTIGGTLMWEYFGETYAPSEIDIATMSLGGVYLGELTHRLSDALWYKISSKNKVLRYTATSLLNPMSRINSFFVKNKVSSYDTNEAPLIMGEFSLGATYPMRYLRNNVLGSRGSVNLSLIYGDLFKPNAQRYQPFDYFIFNSWLDFNINSTDKGLYFNVLSHTPLFVKHLNDNSVLSISQHYDYLTNSAFKIGSLAFTGDYSSQYYWKKWTLNTSIKGGLIVFGSGQSQIVDYIYNSDDPEFERDYVYGSGYTTEAEVLLQNNKFGKFMGSVNRWVIYPARDARGVEDLVLVNIQYHYPIHSNMNVGLQVNYYKRFANYVDYKEFQKIHNSYHEFKSLLSWSF